MSIHPSFPTSPYSVLEPDIRWFPADEALWQTNYDTLIPPLVHKIRQEVTQWRNNNYESASETSKSLLNWWFNTNHTIVSAYGAMTEFRYYFSQREAVETIIFLYEIAKVKDKYDLFRFDSSGIVSTGMFDEEWLRFVVKMATGSGKTKVMSLIIAWC
jgi:type III restriction enzyme